jgi:hypothetical protein
MPVPSDGIASSLITAGQTDTDVQLRRTASVRAWQRCHLVSHWPSRTRIRTACLRLGGHRQDSPARHLAVATTVLVPLPSRPRPRLLTRCIVANLEVANRSHRPIPMGAVHPPRTMTCESTRRRLSARRVCVISVLISPAMGLAQGRGRYPRRPTACRPHPTGSLGARLRQTSGLRSLLIPAIGHHRFRPIVQAGTGADCPICGMLSYSIPAHRVPAIGNANLSPHPHQDRRQAPADGDDQRRKQDVRLTYGNPRRDDNALDIRQEVTCTGVRRERCPNIIIRLCRRVSAAKVNLFDITVPDFLDTAPKSSSPTKRAS